MTGLHYTRLVRSTYAYVQLCADISYIIYIFFYSYVLYVRLDLFIGDSIIVYKFSAVYITGKFNIKTK